MQLSGKLADCCCPRCTGCPQVAAAYGRDSAAYKAAADALVATLRAAVAKLDAGFGGDVVYSVAVVDAVPAAAANQGAAAAQGVMAAAQQAQQRRRLAQYEPWYPGKDEPTAARIFSAKAAGYGAFLALLYFSVAGVWCMCNMRMKQDTLLYPRQKAD